MSSPGWRRKNNLNHHPLLQKNHRPNPNLIFFSYKTSSCPLQETLVTKQAACVQTTGLVLHLVLIPGSQVSPLRGQRTKQMVNFSILMYLYKKQNCLYQVLFPGAKSASHIKFLNSSRALKIRWKKLSWIIITKTWKLEFWLAPGVFKDRNQSA